MGRPHLILAGNKYNWIGLIVYIRIYLSRQEWFWGKTLIFIWFGLAAVNLGREDDWFNLGRVQYGWVLAGISLRSELEIPEKLKSDIVIETWKIF